MAKKFSLINMKGGVGKSTLAVNLAWHFAGYTNWLKRVLLVDLDPQFNASQYLLGPKKYKEIIDKKEPTVYHVFEQFSPMYKNVNLTKAIRNVESYTGGGKLDILPAQLELSYTLKNPNDKARNLKEYIDKIESNYDIIIFDCSPTDSILTEAAYLSSDFILIPIRPEYLSSIGLPLLIKSVEDFKGKYPMSKMEISGIVFNATEEYAPEEEKSKRNVRETASEFGIPVLKNEISYSRSYPKGARENAPIFRTTYSRYDKYNEFFKFTKEFANVIGI